MFSDKKGGNERDNYDREKVRKTGGAEVTGKGISGMSGQVNITHGSSDDQSSPASFRFLAPRETVVAAVNVIDCTPSFRKYLDHKPYKFETRLDLVRDKCEHGYRVCISPGGDKALSVSPAFKKLVNLTSVEQKGKRGILFAKFKGDFFVVVQFKEFVLFDYFKKIMEEIMKLSNIDGKREKYVPPSIATYVVGGGASVLKNLGGLSRAAVSHSTRQSQKDQFYEKKAESWMPPELNDWVNHILIQPDGMTRILTIREHMDSIDDGLYTSFKNYFTFTKGATYLTFFQEIEKHEKDANSVNNHLKVLLANNLIRHTFKQECEILKKNGGLFPINFYLVLKKRLKSVKKYIEGRQFTLYDIVQDLKTKKSFMWNILDMRDFILSFLLYQKEFQIYLEEIEQQFFQKEKELFEEFLPSDVDWNDDHRHVILDPRTWEKLLEDFNILTGFELEKISFPVMIAKEQNNLRFKRLEKFKEMESDTGKITELEDALKRVSQKLKVQEKMYDRVTNKLMEYLESESEDAMVKVEAMEKRSAKIEQNIAVVNKEKKEIEGELKKLTKNKNKPKKATPEIRRLEENIIDHVPAMVMARKAPFMEQARRKRLIRRYLIEELDKKASEGMAEFSVKLVISILKDHKPAAWQRKLLGSLDKFYTPNFYKWGFIHANVQISNVGLHWFSNNLVMVSDLAVGRNYEEVLAIDCLCPLIVNYHAAFDRINALAEEIIRANVNYEYTLINVWGEEGKLNCQEFANRIIGILDYTKFFKIVEDYLYSLRQTLSKKNEKQDIKNLRFLKVSDSFRKAYEVVWKNPKGESFKPDKHNKIYFNSHDQLDTFVNLCHSLNPKVLMDLELPGEYQILKAFDRAFWIGAGNRENEDGKKEGENCPFSIQHQGEKDYNKHQEEESKRLLDEEEVEGEN